MNKNILKELFFKRGKEEYIRKIQEELAELSAAVSHYVDGKITESQLINELADVELQLFKIRMMLNDFDINKSESFLNSIHHYAYTKLKNLEKYL